jgi:hypothetical protein
MAAVTCVDSCEFLVPKNLLLSRFGKIDTEYTVNVGYLKLQTNIELLTLCSTTPGGQSHKTILA